ncbi:ethanolamine ammonia-lyase subunit EutC [Flavonifractor plautii]|jgi:ethanolamine ammonia-lyase small subunit|nr:ethanolamine ammonia-lyase subunit EutC [Flavonifractor plautii]MDB7955862.1 ethanolamine ammonia-lyase subunit EutC [Flavonifractor plautii]
MDAVFTDVPERLLEEMGLFTVQTLCETKDMYLTRPDLGRRFSQETLAELQQRCKRNPDVQLVVSDGLSSTSVSANLRDILPAILQGLSSTGVSVGTPFFIKYGRVGAMDAVTEALGSKVTVILLGERPGLATGESMSAYMTYGGYVGIPEASRTVVSNIHRGGTNPAEAGAFIAELCGRMLKEKASGLALKL